MIALMLCMMVAGIGLAQAVTDPCQVTLRWLRLGGILALVLLAVAGTVHLLDRSGVGRWVTSIGIAGTGSLFVVQLITVQVALRRIQRLAALAGFAAGSSWATFCMQRIVATANPTDRAGWAELALTGPLSSAVLGGFLMAMLLGHAYLTAGTEMTQRPFKRLVGILAIALVLRACASVTFALLPYWSGTATGAAQIWTVTMITARYAVGLIVPGVFTYMIYDCVRRAANQSATGILYVALVLVIIGEGATLTLLGETGLVF